MTREGIFVEDRCVHLPDVNGFQSQIPVRHLHVVAHAANQADNGRATYGLRWFDRDALIGALDLITPRADCANCGDAPGTEDMGEAGEWCKRCCSAAQGSIHDDKENWA